MPDSAPPLRPTILIVDDNPEARRLLALLLKPEGYRLLMARDGDEALAIAEQVPDLSLVILDVMMPGKDGLEVCRRLRGRQGDRYVPIILATALDENIHLAQGLAAGADDYVAKPFNQPELLARIRTALRLKRALDGLLEARELATAAAMTVTLGHEINNPLAVVMGNLQLVLNHGVPDEQTRRKLQAARDAAERIQQLLQRLANMKKVVTTTYLGEVRMLDPDRSSAVPD
jgi:DNA-binding response OmpR family regulator